MSDAYMRIHARTHARTYVHARAKKVSSTVQMKEKEQKASASFD